MAEMISSAGAVADRPVSAASAGANTGGPSAGVAETGVAETGVAGRRSGARPHRWHVVGAVSVMMAAVVVGFVVHRNVSVLSHALRSAAMASPVWLLVTAAVMGFSFLASAVGMVGTVQGRVPLGRTLAVEFAGTFCNRLTPAGVGRTALRARYLVCAGLSVERAASAVALSSIVGAVAYFIGLSAASVATQTGNPVSMAVSPGGIAIFCCSVALLVFLAFESSSHRWRSCERRRRWTSRLRRLRHEMRDLSRDRWALIALIAGPLLASVAYVVAFWAALHSVDASVGLISAGVVYVSATAVAAAVPVPGGVGAAEITLTAGLTTAGVSPGTALSGVLVFRLVSLWLPSAIGAATLLWLRRVGALSTEHPTGPVLPMRPRLLATSARRLGRLSTPKKVVIIGGAVAGLAIVGTGAH